MRRTILKIWIVLLTFTLSLFMVPSSATAQSADSTVVALDYGSTGWSYKQVPYDGEPGFQDPAFDASSWQVGQAGFGTTNGTCPWNTTDRVHTAWDTGTDMLVRHHFTIPVGASNLHISGTVDNNADVYINGTLVQQASNGFCASDGINVDVPAADLVGDNLIAIRARDLGDADFIDVQITYASSGAVGTVTAIRQLPITSHTSLYRLPLQLTLANASCPSDVPVEIGSITQIVHICDEGQSPPSTVIAYLGVWDPNDHNNALTPASSVTATSGTASTTVQLPPRPIWVGVGDSYASGHHQTSTHWFCKHPDSRCGVYPNDPQFAWETPAAGLVNAKLDVPSAWEMMVHVVGRSGHASSEYATDGQRAAMLNDLHDHHLGSWNVVSITGGADDGKYTFADAIEDWYKAAIAHGELYRGVWTADATAPGCPNSEGIYKTALKERPNITENLRGILNDAMKESPGTRAVDVYYPYALPRSAYCAKDHFPHQHGTTAAANMLASAHDALRGLDGLIQVDLRADEFSGGDPRLLLQTIAYYGFPHPNAQGQGRIAAMTASAVIEAPPG